MSGPRPDQLDVWVHVATHQIDQAFAVAKAIAKHWTPDPCPPRAEEQEEGTDHE